MVFAKTIVNHFSNIAIKEYGLERPNIFKGIFIPADAQTKKRLPLPDYALLKVQAECRRLDDQQRWMIAVISDTGMRLSEACGLLSSDINLEGSIPYIDLIEQQQPHTAGPHQEE